MKNLIKVLKKYNKIAIFSHKNPDPDAIGSALALGSILEGLGKKVGYFCGSEMNSNFGFLDGFEKYNIENISDFDLLIALDVASLDMLGEYGEVFAKADSSIRIDHHISGENFAKLNYVKNESSSAIIVYDIATSLKVKINPYVANCIYFGICGDTSIFHNNNTDSKTFLVCSKLLECGAEPQYVYSNFFDKKTVPYVKLTSNCLLGADLDKSGDFAIMTASKDDIKNYGANKNDSIGNLCNTYLACGYKMVVLLKECDDEIRCSLRSKPEYECTKVAEIFGGGGHKNASGCSFTCSLTSAKNKMKKALKEYFKNI